MLSALAVLCPPLAVLATGHPGRAALNLGLTLCLYVPGVVHALAELDKHASARRNDALLRAVTAYYPA
jgi:uncharacterized membrane protein YqaE (UPF0057 family)